MLLNSIAEANTLLREFDCTLEQLLKKQQESSSSSSSLEAALASMGPADKAAKAAAELARLTGGRCVRVLSKEDTVRWNDLTMDHR
jgi:hypothetical protein